MKIRLLFSELRTHRVHVCCLKDTYFKLILIFIVKQTNIVNLFVDFFFTIYTKVDYDPNYIHNEIINFNLSFLVLKK